MATSVEQPSLSLAPSLTPVHQIRYPRRKRLGGFLIVKETLLKWGCILAGKPFDPNLNIGRAWSRVGRRVESFGARFYAVGEGRNLDELEWMVVTRIEPFKGWSGMDPLLIPQFEEGEREKEARKRLQADGLDPSDYTFKTELSS